MRSCRCRCRCREILATLTYRTDGVIFAAGGPLEFQLEYFAGKRSREVRETLNWREKKSFFVDACGHLRGGGKKATKAPSGLGGKKYTPLGTRSTTPLSRVGIQKNSSDKTCRYWRVLQVLSWGLFSYLRWLTSCGEEKFFGYRQVVFRQVDDETTKFRYADLRGFRKVRLFVILAATVENISATTYLRGNEGVNITVQLRFFSKNT